MLRIDRAGQTFSTLSSPTLAEVSITERYDLQEYIANSPNEFFAEIGLQLFLVGKEILPSRNVQDRIDLLGIDQEGAVVVLELKRGNHKLHLLQSISYAAMISKWTADDFLDLLDDDAQERLAQFLNVETSEINSKQKIVLIAEAFDYSVLVSAEWLSEINGIDISCCRIAIAKDELANAEYLVCSNVYPTPELADEAVRRGRERTVKKAKWQDWDAALANIDNPEVVAYFRQEIEEGTEAYLRRRILYYRIGGKRRWFVSARKARSYCWQYGRFEGDLEYWVAGLSEAADVKILNDGRSISFQLGSKEDYDFYKKSVSSKLSGVNWQRSDLADDVSEEGDES